MGDKSQKDKDKDRKQKAIKTAEETQRKRAKQEGDRFDSPKTQPGSPPA